MAASYGQIVTTLREEIVSGLYTAAVPPGSELAARFGVSESTINRALSQLRSEGFVRTQPGRGTMVNPVPVIRRDAVARQRAGTRESGGSRGAFDAELRAADLDPRTEVEVGRAVPVGSIARLLAIPEGTEAVYRNRRMFAGDWPVQVATSWIPAAIADGTPIAEQDTGPGGIYSRLAEIGHAPAQFTEEVRVRVPDDGEVTALGIDPDHRVYTITRVSSDRAGRPVEVNTIVMPTHQWTLAYTWQAE
ncbi:MAG TPA: GntR family transcriptional regulator [Trebonia sp.]|jgi:GntR family transcriptional regulator|nr:GntR family transcriptional regulator [Trebonia sp.]